MSGVIKVAAMVGAVAGEGAAAVTDTLTGYSIAMEVLTGEHRVSKKFGHDCGQGAVILIFTRGALAPPGACSTCIRFDHVLGRLSWHIKVWLVWFVVFVSEIGRDRDPISRSRRNSMVGFLLNFGGQENAEGGSGVETLNIRQRR